jgi:hypothetical protein
MEGLDKLKKLRLHDQNFESFNFDLEKQKVTIIVSIYSENTKKCSYWKMEFLNVRNLKMSELSLLELLSLEINSHEIIEDLNTILIEFVMLLGIGQPTFNLSFNFSEVALNLQSE